MGPDASTTGDRARTLRAVLLGVLVVALLASVAWLVIEVRDRVGEENSAQSERDAVMLRAREWMVEAWNYGPDDLGDDGTLSAYADRVYPLISTSFRADFDNTLALLEANMAESEISMAATVDRVGVESIDADRATVIIGGQLTPTVAGASQGASGYLWRADLVKVNGQWRVDDFNSFGSAE
ncbi:hypothetical protein [Nocardioides sp. AE5]|uniref:hypothetical protein n=1 Tax=Nocardioides sp. AE5 TaxID=2962573 RepID=UPI0028811285|nr:hypothetical protein [Nocardioides sp. AE5]MDT0200759.1 hypothetical protein [Nocardioides sp. AE5]